MGKLTRKTSASFMIKDFTLTSNHTTVQPGQTLEVAVKLTPKKNLDVRRASVYLTRVETIIDIRRTSKGTTEIRQQIEENIAEHILAENQKVIAMSGIDANVEFLVPLDALPTIKGRTAHRITPGVSWKIKSEIDVPDKIDPIQEQDIIVIKPLGTDISASYPNAAPVVAPIVTNYHHSECSLILSLQSIDVYRGSNIEGTLRVTAHKNINVSNMIIKLARIEKFGDTTKQVKIDKIMLNQTVHLPAGKIYDWPFEINTSKAEIPSLRLKRSQVKYTLTGQLDRKRRKDISIAQHINIYI